MKFSAGLVLGILLGMTVTYWLMRSQGLLSRGEQELPTAAEAEGLPVDFTEFYTRFHGDSAFQLQHIQWPLAGIPEQADSIQLARGNYQWTQEQWQTHKPFNSEGGTFKQNFEVLSKDLIVERIRDKDEQFGMERRFAKLSEGWYLIYYAGMNKLK